ncbi:MAG TPA: hypothetical protein VFN67_00700 [Polyangiales bacterium]|nr:hypothetical protein [Polyangiales bacterium]
MSSSDSLGSNEQTEAAGQTQDLRFSKKHKHHWKRFDKCEPMQCESVELYVDSFKHHEATKELDRSIRVSIPKTLPALYWGSDVEAQLSFDVGDDNVVCTYVADSQRRGRALVLESCDNGAGASDTITSDSVTLNLACSHASFAKVHVKLHELEPCGEMACDPTEIDDGDPCTIDACDADGSVTHTPAADGTSCDDGDACNGHECCVAGKCVNPKVAPLECADETKVVFHSDFDTGAIPSEITPGTARLTGVQGYAGLGTDYKFEGRFLRSATLNRVTLQLNDLPAHDTLDLRFLFAAIDSLDGSGTYPAGENFIISVDDIVIFMESFANAGASKVQSYVPPPGVQLARMVNLGFRANDVCYVDSAYDMGKDPTFLGIVHTASSVTISFEYVGEGAQIIEDESWAFDQLEVSVHKATTCEDCGELPPAVDDNNPCTSDSCDPKLGVLHEPVAAGTSCGAAANACDGPPVCNSEGACVAGTPLSCDDGNACNGVEQCNAATGCVAGTPLDCNDGNACNGVEQCAEATGCVAGTPLDCNDGNACNGVEQCDDATGCVTGTPLSCDDGDACNGVEQCDDASGCKSGTPPIVEDDNPCTIEMCDPLLGVVRMNAPDGMLCNGPNNSCEDGECLPFS